MHFKGNKQYDMNKEARKEVEKRQSRRKEIKGY
jgi:hypothetical protein